MHFWMHATIETMQIYVKLDSFQKLKDNICADNFGFPDSYITYTVIILGA